MARRKQEIALQMQIETQEEWEELMAKEGLNGMYICMGSNSHWVKSKF